MDIQVEDVGPCTKRVKLSIPADEVSKRLEKSFEEISRGVQFKGFRKGRVPRHMIEKRVGSHIRDDLKEELIREGLKEAVDKHELKLIGDFHLHLEEVKLDPKAALEFETEVEVRPEFEVGEYKGVSVTVPTLEVTDDEVEGVLDDMRRQRAEYSERTKGASETGDLIEGVVTFSNSVGEAVSDPIRLSLETTSEVLLDRQVPELKEKLVGRQAGDTLELELDLPDQGLNQEEFAGQPGRASIAIEKVQTPSLPELDDDFAAEFEASDMDDLRVRIRQGVLREKTRHRNDLVDQRILDQILAQTPFELPDSMVKQELGEALLRYKTRLEQAGVESEKIPAALEAYKTQAREQLIRDVRGFFVLNQLADKEEVFVTESEVEETLAQIGQGYGKSADEVKAWYQQNDQLHVLRNQLKHNKVKKLLRDNAEITEEGPVAGASTSDSGGDA